MSGKRRYQLNERYFQFIDSEPKAYWLGFLYADGCVSGGNVQVQLQASDEDHIVKWHDAIETQRPLIYFARTLESGEHRYVCSHIRSLPMAADLMRHGCVERKTGHLQWPDLSSGLERHFARGLYDGDGSVFLRKRPTERPQITVKWSCDKPLLERIASLIHPSAQVRSSGSVTSPFVHQLTIEGNRQAGRVLEWLYADATVWLTRKREVYERHFETIRSWPAPGNRYDAFGESKTLTEWADDERCVVARFTLERRIKRGWSVEDALETKSWRKQNPS